MNFLGKNWIVKKDSEKNQKKKTGAVWTDEQKDKQRRWRETERSSLNTRDHTKKKKKVALKHWKIKT